MPKEKTCPFCHIFSNEKHPHCNKSECQLWFIDLSMCSISLGMNSLLSIRNILSSLSEKLRNHYPD
ncbi:hypothetical protein ES705_25644 [subsurface metagenome]